MSDPIRWRDGPNDAPDGASAMLRRVRPTRGISNEQRALARAAITGAALAGAPATAAWASSLGAKIVIAVVAVGATVTVVKWSRIGRRTTNIAPVVQMVRPPVPPPVAVVPPVVKPVAPAVAVIEPVPAVPSVDPVVAPAHAAAVRTHAATTNTNTPPEDPLGAEVSALESARQLLDSNPSAALRRLRSSATAFRQGSLVAEREYLIIEALHRMGRTRETRTHAQSFLSRYPASPYVAPVRRIMSSLTQSNQSQ